MTGRITNPDTRKHQLNAFLGRQSALLADESLVSDEKAFSLLKNILRHTSSAGGGIILPLPDNQARFIHYSLDIRKNKEVRQEGEREKNESLFGLCLNGKTPIALNDLSKKPKPLKGRTIPKGVMNFLAIPVIHGKWGQCGLYLMNATNASGYTSEDKREAAEIARNLLPLLFLSLRSIELEREADVLRKSQKFKEEMMHMVVHDLKGPLAEVMSNLDVLKGSERLAETDLEILASAEKGCSSLWGMIMDILDLSKLQENKLNLKKEPFNVVDLVKSCLDGLKRQFGERGVISVFQPQDHLPSLQADRNLIARVLTNLLLNALNFTKEGKKITVETTLLPFKRIDIAVHDEGRGIRQEDIPFIFDRFNQSSGGGVPSGTGIGLTFCKFAVEAHNGEIKVESTVNKGSSFHVILPLGASRLQLDGV